METRDIKRSSSKQRYWTIILSLGVKVGLAGGSTAWNMGYRRLHFHIGFASPMGYQSPLPRHIFIP
jgi:hypothetical protein